jgi:DNA-binding NarL/FixJ family response regulator
MVDPSTGLIVVAGVQLHCDGVAALLQARDGLHVVGVATELSAMRALIAERQPQVVVLDATMPGAAELVRAIHALDAALPIVAVALDDSDLSILTWLALGISGYILMNDSADALSATIQRVVHGERVCSSRASAALFRRIVALTGDRAPAGELRFLTMRERQILNLIAEGLSNKAIAAHLNIETATVKNHVHNLLDKLHVHSRGAAAARLRLQDRKN